MMALLCPQLPAAVDQTAATSVAGLSKTREKQQLGIFHPRGQQRLSGRQGGQFTCALGLLTFSLVCLGVCPWVAVVRVEKRLGSAQARALRLVAWRPLLGQDHECPKAVLEAGAASHRAPLTSLLCFLWDVFCKAPPKDFTSPRGKVLYASQTLPHRLAGPQMGGCHWYRVVPQLLGLLEASAHPWAAEFLFPVFRRLEGEAAKRDIW